MIGVLLREGLSVELSQMVGVQGEVGVLIAVLLCIGF